MDKMKKKLSSILIMIVFLISSGFTIPKKECEFRTFTVQEFNKNNRQLVSKINRCAWYDMDLKTRYYIPLNLETTWSPLSKQLKNEHGARYILICNLKEFAVGFYDSGILIDWCNMLAGNTTPNGEFRPLTFDEEHYSSKYKMPDGRDAPMPYAIRFSGAYWIHAGDVIAGENLSHGCINVPSYFMKWIFYMGKDNPNNFLIIVR
jgi:hypothetical protein